MGHGTATSGNSPAAPQMSKHIATLWPSNSTLRLSIQEKPKPGVHANTGPQTSTAVFFKISKKWTHKKRSLTEVRMPKMWCGRQWSITQQSQSPALTHAPAGRRPERNMPSDRSRVQDNSIYRKSAGHSNLSGWKGDEAGGGGKK